MLHHFHVIYLLFWRSPSLGSVSTAHGGSLGGLMGSHRALDKSMRTRNSVDGQRNMGTAKSLSPMKATDGNTEYQPAENG